MATQSALAIAIEEERARRLVDRVAEDLVGELDSFSELARAQRAHQLSANLRKETEIMSTAWLEDDSRRERLNDSLRGLECELEARLQYQLMVMLVEEMKQNTLLNQPVDPSTVESTTLATEVLISESTSAADRLSKALGQLSLQSILDIRLGANGRIESEAIVTAVAHTIANVDDHVQPNIHHIDPDSPWPDALKILDEPANFLSALKCFPDAVDAGRVTSSNIAAARRFLHMANLGENCDANDAMSDLAGWVSCAICYWGERTHEKFDEVPKQVLVLAEGKTAMNVARKVVSSPVPVAAQVSPREDRTPRQRAIPRPVQRASPVVARQATPPRAYTPRSQRAYTPRSQTVTTPRNTSTLKTRGKSPHTPSANASKTVQRQVSGPQQLTSISGTSLLQAKRDSTPAHTRTAPSDAVPVVKTVQRLGGLHSARRNNGKTQRAIDVNLDKGGNCLARAGSTGASQHLSTQEWRRMIKEAKKEVREIHSMEGKMKIDLERDEKRERMASDKMMEEDVREGRARDAEEMKQVMEWRAREFQTRYLQESKEFQEFKRECKVRGNGEDLKTFEEEYAKDLDNSSWRICRAQALVEENKMLLMERANDVNEIKEIKQEQMFQYKMMVENDRHLANMSEMTRIEQELGKEKEMLLGNLQFAEACRKPVRSGAL